MKLVRLFLLFVALTLSPIASAVWIVDWNAPFRADGPIDIQMRIGAFLYLQVGTAGGTVDTVGWDLTNVNLGDSVPVNAVTPALTVVVRGNNGAITLGAKSFGPQGLVNGTGDFLNYNEILTNSSNNDLPAPALVNGVSTTVNIVANQFNGLVTAQKALWTYRLANTVIPAAGTYGGGVTYTASTP